MLFRYLWRRILRLQNSNNNNQLSLKEAGKVDDFIQSGTDKKFGSGLEKTGGGPPALNYLFMIFYLLAFHSQVFFLFEWPKNQCITSVETRYCGRNRCKVYPVYEKQGRAAGIYAEGFHWSELADSRFHPSIKLCNRL